MNIYDNPLIDKGFYWVKVIDVRVEPCSGGWPRLHIRLQVGLMHEEIAGMVFTSVIHPSDASMCHRLNFLAAFRAPDFQYKDAIGRWSSVEIYPAEYGGTHYSAVRYAAPPRLQNLWAIWLERVDEAGRLTKETLENSSFWNSHKRLKG